MRTKSQPTDPVPRPHHGVASPQVGDDSVPTAAITQAEQEGLTTTATSTSTSSTSSTSTSSTLLDALARVTGRATSKMPGGGFESAQVLTAVEQMLGIDLTALRDLQKRELVQGHIDLRLLLDDDKVWTIPVPGRDPLRIEVPRSPYGTEACFRIELGAPSDGGAGPVLKGLSLTFDTPGRNVNPELHPPMPLSAYPRLLNPSVLSPPAKTWTDRLTAVAKDAVADVRLRAASVDETGKIKLMGEVVVVGFDMQDLQPLAEGKLPVLPTTLRQVRGATKGPTEAAAQGAENVNGTPLADMLKLFSHVARGGSWDARLAFAADNADVNNANNALVSVQTSGLVTLNQDLDMKGGARISLSSNLGTPGTKPHQSLDIGIDGDANALTKSGELSVSLDALAETKAKKATSTQVRVTQGVKWDKEGMTLNAVDVDRVLPVKLQKSVGVAPRVGTAAFAARIDTLLRDAPPPIAGCAVSLLSTGDVVFDKRLEMLRKAGPGDTVLLQTYIFKDDVSGTQIIDELVAARKRGANVKVLLDALGSVRDPAELLTGPAAAKKLRKAGIEVALFNVPLSPLGDELASTAVKSFRREISRHTEGGIGSVPKTVSALKAAGLGSLATVVDVLTQAKTPADLFGDPRRVMALAAAAVAARSELSRASGLLPKAALRHLTVLLSRELLERVPEVLRGLGRDHRKQMVVYGERDGVPHAEMNTGGNNIGDDYLLQPGSDLLNEKLHAGMRMWNDADLNIQSSGAVAQAADNMWKTWQAAGGGGDAFAPVPDVPPAPIGKASTLRVVHHHPVGMVGDDGDDHYANVLLATLEGLGRGDEIAIENPYFLPLPGLRDAMVEAARRGARLRVVTNGLNENNDNLLVARLSRRFILPPLVAEPNIEVYETRGDARPIHRKTYVVRNSSGNGDLYALGSHNLDHLSARINREMFVLGGTALDRSRNGPCPIVEGLLADLRRDTSPTNATRVVSAHLQGGDLDDLASDWVASLLLPVL